MTATMKAAFCGHIVAATIYKQYFYGVFIWGIYMRFGFPPLTPNLSSHQLDITPMPKSA